MGAHAVGCDGRLPVRMACQLTAPRATFIRRCSSSAAASLARTTCMRVMRARGAPADAALHVSRDRGLSGTLCICRGLNRSERERERTATLSARDDDERERDLPAPSGAESPSMKAWAEELVTRARADGVR